jgi:hypothetical protein
MCGLDNPAISCQVRRDLRRDLVFARARETRREHELEKETPLRRCETVLPVPFSSPLA